MTAKPLNDVDLHVLQTQFNPDMALPHLLQSASTVLSSLTQLTGIVALPRRNRIQLRQVEFLPLSSNRVLVILVLNNREVENRIIYTDRVYSANELQQTANYLNAHFTGKDLLVIRQEMSVALREDRDNMAQLLEATLDVAGKIFARPTENSKDYLIAGQNNLLNCSSHQADFERLRLLFNAISEKQDMLNLLDQALEAEGVQIFIGKESGYQAFDDCSIVTQSYSVDGQLVGSLGVIGPRRMPYERVVSAVDITAKLLSAALNQV
jgi:heat-inducible transcriptional repressor